MHYALALIHAEDESIENILAPFQENNMGDCPKEYLEFFVEYTKEEAHAMDEKDYTCFEQDEHGNWGYWFNPESQWDWWEIGGRWKNILQTKDGTRCNSARIGDIDLKIFRALPLYATLVDGEWDFLSDTGWKNKPLDLTKMDENLMMTIIDYHM
jgi:hypothetical protein